MPIDTAELVRWGHAALTVLVDVSPHEPVRLRTLSCGPAAPSTPELNQPLVELLVAGSGRAQTSQRLNDTAVGRRLRHVGSVQSVDGSWHQLRLDLRDEQSGLSAAVFLRSRDGVSACQTWTTVTNDGTAPVLLQAVTSFAAGFSGGPVDDLDVLSADSEWLAEGRWTRRALRESAAVDLNLGLHGQDGRGRLAVTSGGTWSTGRHLPTAGLTDRVTGHTWLWQIEHNGAWRWEIGERLAGAYVALLGPTDPDHQWLETLQPGESFTTVPVSVAVSDGGLDGAVQALTAHRRALVRPDLTGVGRPVVFNDYMNTLMGDPTTAKLLPLIDAAAQVGADVFCVDAGWYDDGGAWWDSVGQWLPSTVRFPGGIGEVLDRIRERGMVPGLWLEPEVIGVRSVMADRLPAAAFLQRGGVRLVEHGRYHLDLRHPAAVAHLDEVVDRLVGMGVGYLKLDYNIDPGPGTDLAADSVGSGLLGHNRAHLAWLDGVLDRHPHLILENCASGAMRMDYALLSRLHLQSTSDQQDYLRYPPIAVAAPMSMLPEQAANWAYPQPDMTDEQIAFTLCTGLAGRLYLSGDLAAMTEHQRAAVAAAVQAHHLVRDDLDTAVAHWPLGLPAWTDPWLSLALTTADTTWLTVWRRPGASTDTALHLPHLAGRDVDVDVIYPRDLDPWTSRWDAVTATLHLESRTPTPTARMFRIRAHQ
ncbi:glycoside hydrolase family 36 protein [Catellatospora sichuanensis]|uniref:glycoside hydrolase family 36 protein n=1 Tax=Catellatospora sichuanensis TaxID=1969805 RepID=UPI0011844726|nr:glycoside hydrolase family 36 protein [Catellatospora sichuanensis]